ncbi:MAG: DNA-3-methyladenine glycosylase 2 family protein [Gemmatimonadota bacterium]|nr:DNA-3-methyladenine glycosylase 2 family protein [Gemmatimonadota bacterium]
MVQGPDGPAGDARTEGSPAGRADPADRTAGPPAQALTSGGLARAAAGLGASDREFQGVLDRWGAPPLWDREPSFATLVHIILEQQVSLASAAAALRRLQDAIGHPEPESFLALDDDRLLRIGFSRQKRVYARDVASRLLDGRLDLTVLTELSDSEVRDRLMEVKGIGRWTADVYLLMVLLRPDIWPVGDRALVVALRELKGLGTDPDADGMRNLADAWRPWRSVAARILWHFYLNEVRPAAAP